MQMQTKHFVLIPLVLLTILGGCSKKEKSSDKKSTKVSKASKKAKRSTGRSVGAFDLDSDSMKSFALDDQLDQHSKDFKADQENNQNPLFSWENLDAEESKHQFKTIYFEFDKDMIAPEQHAALRQDEQEAKKMIKAGKIIVIEGHACHSAGSAIYNLALSERRARYVAQKFAEAGIDASNIKIAPRGSEMPVRRGGSRAEQWVNRRVEIYAIDRQ